MSPESYCLMLRILKKMRKPSNGRLLIHYFGWYIIELFDKISLHRYIDRVVISSPQFPNKYWDKFIRKKVWKKYEDTTDSNALKELLGLHHKEGAHKTEFDIR